jgi:serine/threonine-protein kinase RsbW
MHEGSITIRLPADVREIERLNRLVRQFGELHEIPTRALYAVNLALDEVVTNVVLYGFESSSGQEVAVRVETTGDDLRSEVVDAGREFNPLNAPVPDLTVALEDRALGGLGIHLVRSLMDRVEYRRENAKNVLTMRKRIR